MVIFHSYVCLPEGKRKGHGNGNIGLAGILLDSYAGIISSFPMFSSGWVAANLATFCGGVAKIQREFTQFHPSNWGLAMTQWLGASQIG